MSDDDIVQDALDSAKRAEDAATKADDLLKQIRDLLQQQQQKAAAEAKPVEAGNEKRPPVNPNATEGAGRGTAIKDNPAGQPPAAPIGQKRHDTPFRIQVDVVRQADQATGSDLTITFIGPATVTAGPGSENTYAEGFIFRVLNGGIVWTSADSTVMPATTDTTSQIRLTMLDP